MNSQKHLFDLPEDVHYLNGAYMSPLLKSVREAGIAGIDRKINPAGISTMDFFLPAEEVKNKFAKIVNADPRQVALFPSASYGLKSVISNLPVHSGSHAIIAAQEFPSDYYTIQSWCRKTGKQLKTVSPSLVGKGRGAAWNRAILDSITTDTAVVLIEPAHWADGTLFHLKDIGEKCQACNTRLIIDGTQSVGALPVDVTAFHIDALICASYKWLMGPYSMAIGFIAESFNEGAPIEDSWMNRANAHDLTSLTRYTDEYFPGAARYNVGEYSNPILLPMLDRALDQILDWQPDHLQEYCAGLIAPLLEWCGNNGCIVEDPAYRPNHLFGITLPVSMHKTKLLETLHHQKVYISVRGEAIRISPNVYNSMEDIEL